MTGRREEAVYDKTIKEYFEAIKQNPQDDKAYYNLGNAYYANKQYKEALEQYQKASKIKPEAVYYSLIGDVYRALNNLNEAMKNYEEALKINPKSDWANNGLGNAYFSKGDYDNAIKFYTKAIDISPNPVYYTNIGDSYRNKKDMDKAILYYEEAIGSNSEYVPAHNALGVVYYSKGEYDKAIEHYRNAISIDKKNNKESFIYYANLGNAYSAKKDWDEAIKNYMAAIRIEPNDDLSYNGLGNTYFGMGLYSHAIEQYQKAIAINPDRYPIYYSNIGDALRRLKRWNDAIEYYRKAIDKAAKINAGHQDMEFFNRGLALAHNDLGVDYYTKGENDKAIEEYRKACDLGLETDITYRNLSLAYDARGNYRMARENLLKAIKLNPNEIGYSGELKNIESKLKE